ncbi:MAG: ABC transporter ATP-binding protein [candidate division Zixibacteria bacterium]|nr:ABC transporter ATP-binding protein [candidate division Zixibacteria bacterium]
MTNNDISLSISGLSKSYGDTKVLSDVNIDLRQGELLVALGPSGCGKTTLLRLIAGLETPDSGEIWLEGKKISSLPPKDRDLSLVFQNYALYPHMTVAGNLEFPLKVKKVPRVERKKQIAKIAELLDLTEKLNSKPGELSGGQRQRVALGRAIIRKPSLYLLDEPLSNLDSQLRSRMRSEIVALQKKLETCAIYVTHDQTEALTMADRIMLLHEGRVRQIGTPEEIYRAPVDMFVAGFIGFPRINFVECSLDEKIITPFGIPLEILAPMYRNIIISRGEKFIVGLRPEDIYPGPLGEFKGIVTSVEFHGDRKVATLDFAGTSLTFYTDSKTISRGDEIAFNLRRDNLLFFNLPDGRRVIR